MHTLLIETGKHLGKRLRIPTGEIVVGRDESTSIRIASNEVSRRHCVFHSTRSGLTVQDLGSSNGTFVNGVPITAAVELNPGDLVMIGPMALRLVERAPGLAAARRPARAQSREEEPLSDDDIAAWLSTGSEEEVSSGDTAVLPTATSLRLQPPIPPSGPRRVFSSVAEEAADIIRRHKQARGES